MCVTDAWLSAAIVEAGGDTAYHGAQMSVNTCSAGSRDFDSLALKSSPLL